MSIIFPRNPFSFIIMACKIVTNNQPRQFLTGWDEEIRRYRDEFDYLSDEEFDNELFFMYQGEPYAMSQFSTYVFGEATKDGWNGIMNDTAFSGVLVNVLDGERVIVGRYFC